MTLQATLEEARQRLDDGLDDLGRPAALLRAARSAGAAATMRRYKKEVLRLLAEVSLGTGALAVIGGTVGVIAFLAFFTGTEVGLQGYSALNQLGSSAFTGFVSAYFNTREIAPLVAGLALAATVGCGFTAQLGAMRISEEVDALEVMGIPSLPFLVTTRMIAGFVAVIPLYVLGLLSSYVATRLITTGYYGQSTGTYDHYFHLFLPPGRRALVVRQGAGLRGRDHPDPLLLRLHAPAAARPASAWPSARRSAPRSSPSTSSTSSSASPSGAPPPPCGSRGSADADARRQLAQRHRPEVVLRAYGVVVPARARAAGRALGRRLQQGVHRRRARDAARPTGSATSSRRRPTSSCAG